MPSEYPLIDMHVHVGLRGDKWSHCGKFSEEYIKSTEVALFLKYGRLGKDEVNDVRLREKTLENIRESHIDRVVCLALDPIYDPDTGERREDLSHVWVDNEYISYSLKSELPDKILLGASVHPYDPKFEERVTRCVDDGAVLLKWLPSAQQIDLAHKKVISALKFLATAKNGKPLPLLLHIGSEYAIPPYDKRAKSYDFISWSFWDRFWNGFRGKDKWYKPNTNGIRKNIESALEFGAVIIFAHCGAPYFSGGLLGGIAEHSEYKNVKNYLQNSASGKYKGRCYADISAFVVHTRQPFHKKIKKLPGELLLFGSDFPVPIMELSAGPKEWWKDLKNAVTNGRVDPLFVPDGNLLDVNYRELKAIFGDHPLFDNFAKLLSDGGI